MSIRIQKVVKFTPGWIEDVNYTVNPGYIKLKNAFLNSLGKIQKRMGWALKRMWKQPGLTPGAEGNLPLNYSYPVAGSDACARTNFMHIKSKLQPDGTMHKYCLVHRIKNGKNALVKIEFDENGDFVAETQIATPEQFKNYGPVKFIETPDMVYIINTFNSLSSGTKKGYIWKYAYGLNINALDTERIHNISISNSMYATAEILKTSSAGLAIGKYYYFVMPEYNTQTVGRGDSATFVVTAASVDITEGSQHAIIKVLSPYDPYIVAYRIYRSKKNGSALEAPKYLCRVVKPANNTNPEQLVELINPTSPIFVISGTNRRVTDMNTTDEQLGSALPMTPFLNSYKHLWQNFSTYSHGQNPPSTVYDNQLNLPISCGCFAQNRLILGYGKNLYFSLPNNSDSIDGTLTLMPPLAHETENPLIAIEEVGPYIFCFCKSAIYKLIPTSNTTTPFQLSPVSTSYGCDSLSSITILDNIAYFMFRNKLHAMNAYGQIKEIGGPIASVFETIKNGTDFNISKNDKEKFIRIMFLTDANSREIDFYPDLNYFVDNAGYRDIFVPESNTEVDLSVENERYRLTAYEYNHTTGEEWGVTYDGDIVKKDVDYIDKTIASTVTNWQEYDYAGTTQPRNSYPVELLFEKAFSYPERVGFLSFLLYGTGKVYISFSIDGSNVWSKEKLITLTRAGTETLIDAQGFSVILRLRHTENSSLDLDFYALKFNASGKVDFLNKIDNTGA